MTGIERLREFVEGISPVTTVCGVTKTAYDREHREEVWVRLRDFLADIADQTEREWDELRAEVSDMRPRLMPEGMEWPRFEDGEAVRVGDEYECWCGETHKANSITIREGSSIINATNAHSFVVSDGPTTAHGERVKRPAKVLDADGAEIRVGDTVWDTEFGCEFVVTKVSEGTVFVAFEDESADRYDPANLTHRAPVLAADGRPLREGETVWVTMDNPYGAALLKGDEVTVRFVPHAIVHVEDKEGAVWHVGSNDLTHERPDSWERLEEDAGKDRCSYFGVRYQDCGYCEQSSTACSIEKAKDLVRRAKALAGLVDPDGFCSWGEGRGV